MVLSKANSSIECCLASIYGNQVPSELLGVLSNATDNSLDYLPRRNADFAQQSTSIQQFKRGIGTRFDDRCHTQGRDLIGGDTI